MRINKLRIILLQIILLLMISCSVNDNGENMPSSEKTELETLQRIIQLPITPIKVSWQTGNLVESDPSIPGPDDWALVAVLKFEVEQIAELVKSAKVNGTTASIPSGLFFPWLEEAAGPVFVKAAGDYYEWNTEVYDAEVFSKSPLLHGFFVPISETELLLYLYSN